MINLAELEREIELNKLKIFKDKGKTYIGNLVDNVCLGEPIEKDKYDDWAGAKIKEIFVKALDWRGEIPEYKSCVGCKYYDDKNAKEYCQVNDMCSRLCYDLYEKENK